MVLTVCFVEAAGLIRSEVVFRRTVVAATLHLQSTTLVFELLDQFDWVNDQVHLPHFYSKITERKDCSTEKQGGSYYLESR